MREALKAGSQRFVPTRSKAVQVAVPFWGAEQDEGFDTPGSSPLLSSRATTAELVEETMTATMPTRRKSRRSRAFPPRRLHRPKPQQELRHRPRLRDDVSCMAAQDCGRQACSLPATAALPPEA
mmetsp:Transcript_179176/g.568537  ORF Transcript_179176/g.568537 Transcript_179176/m.568537 type:complete len:124 (-) Transcript_179176:1874-2245(-)